MSVKGSITLYTLSWGGYWDIYGKEWSRHVNNLNTRPDEIIIVSDVEINASTLNYTNVKNIVIKVSGILNPTGHYRNVAVENSSSEWVVASDIDDEPLSNYLDNLDSDADICAFSFVDKPSGKVYTPNEQSLKDRLLGMSNLSSIPGTSAFKKSIFNNIKYEDNCYEDKVLYATLSKLNIKVVNVNPESPRFIYSGFHENLNPSEVARISNIYTKVLSSNRNIYCFWFSETMSQNRKNSLDVLTKKSGCNLVLINNKTFYDYEKLEIPIHKGFRYLSDVHKSDYARAYIMYFYGEGYTDIKANAFDWNQYFDQLFFSKFDAAASYTQNFTDSGNFWNDNKDIEKIMSQQYSKLMSMGHYIFKPRTKLAYGWISLIHKKMDEKFDILSKNPSMHAYSVKGGIHSGYKDPVDPKLINPDYPFEWAELGGVSLHQVQYESGMKDLLLTMPMSNMDNYR